MKILNDYSSKLVEIDLFKLNNAQVFKDFEILQEQLSILESQLKEEVKAGGQDVQNDIVKVSISERWRKFYDYDLFVAHASQVEVDALSLSKGIKKEIDKLVFEELVKQGMIESVTKQASFKEEKISTSILIKTKL